MKDRLVYIDVIKFLAIMWVFGVHYIAIHNDNYFDFWREGVSAWFLGGVTGKAAVAMFGVILGFFAYTKGGSRKKTILELSVNRYAYFFIAGGFINLLYIILENAGIRDNIHDAYDLIKETILLDDGIFPTYWCIQAFFFASVISYINGQHGWSYIAVILEIIAFYYVGETWIAICLIGNLIALIMRDDKKLIYRAFSNPFVQIIMLVFVFFIIKRPESRTTFMIDGICSLMIIMILCTSKPLGRALSIKPLAYVGRHSMGLYIMHPIVSRLLGAYLIEDLFAGMNQHAAFILSFAVCAVAVIAVSIPLNMLFVKCASYVTDFVVMVKKKIPSDGRGDG